MTWLLPLASGIALGLASWQRDRGRIALSLALFGVALAILVPLHAAPMFVIVGPLCVALLGLALAHRERERALVADHLTAVRIEGQTLTRGTAPNVVDELGRASLASLDARATELARTATPSVPPVKPGVRARFMAAMGHELRSPLNSISGFAQLLEDGSEGPLTDAQKENVVHVRRAASELLTLLTDILDTARIEAGRVTLERRWVAPIEVITLALQRIKDQSEAEEAIAIDVQVQPGLDPLHVDRERMAQALTNVLRAITRRGVRLEARVREVDEAGQRVVRFELVDRTRAMGEAEAARAFEPDPTLRPTGRSLAGGLALSLARDLVQLHGGDARAENVAGGATYAIWVPVEDR